MFYILIGLIGLYVLIKLFGNKRNYVDTYSVDLDDNSFTKTVDTELEPPPRANNSKVNFEVNGNSYYLHVMDILLLYWIDGKQVETLKFPQYFQHYDTNPLNELKVLLQNDLVILADDRKSLAQLKVVDLKEILRNNDQKVSGKKQELIDRIVDYLPSDAYKPFISDTYTLSDDGYKLIDKFDLVIQYHKKQYFQIEPHELLPYLYSEKSTQEIFIEINEKKMWHYVQIGYIPMASISAKNISEERFDYGDYDSALVYGIIEFLFATCGLSNSDRENYYFIVPFQPNFIRIDRIINAQLQTGYTNLEVLHIARKVFDSVDKVLPKPYLYRNEDNFTEMLNYYLTSSSDKAYKLAKALYYKVPQKYRSIEFDRYS